MKKHNIKFNGIKKLFICSVFVLVILFSLNAATLYWDGTGTWDSSTSNWGAGTGGPYNTGPWNNATPDSAILEGTAGNVTLGDNITIDALTISSNNYIITDNGYTLSFSSGSSLTSDYTLTLGDINWPTTFNIYINGNVTVSSFNNVPVSGGPLRKYGSGRLTVNGLYDHREGGLYGGDLVMNGKIQSNYRDFDLIGGTLHYNNAGAYDCNNASRGLRFAGGNLDNSSGSAITTSTYNPDLIVNANIKFIGSLGVNSDLYMGTGTVVMNASRTITVDNAATTFSIGGVVSDGGSAYKLTKAGSGNLKLTGVNTYTGSTVINAGILTVTQTYFSSTANVTVDAGSTLNLDFSGTVSVGSLYLSGNVKSGTWGAVGSGSENEDSSIRGSGNIYSSYGTPVTGTRYWDGGSTDIASAGDSTAAGGAGTWNTTTTNWDAGTGVAHAAWNNSNNDTAHFGTSTGTVTVASSITAGNLYFENAGGYTFTGSEISIVTGGIITNDTTSGTTTFNCSVTGSPNVILNAQTIDFSPDSGSTTLGIITVNSGSFTIGGSTTNNSLISIPKVNSNYSFAKNGTGTWTVGDLYAGHININAGVLIANGTLKNDYRNITLYSGATLHYNNAAAVQDRGGTGSDWNIYGGSLDNTSGSAITTSTTNPRQRWYGDWEFIGSNGASSDLTLGNGDVVLYTANRTITITHPQTTLTIAGIIQGAYSLTKSGNGTFKTTGINTYTGNTTILAGTLSLAGGSSLVDSTTLYIESGCNVYLANDETVDALYIEGIQAWAGSWGSTSSNSTYKDNIYFSGAGNLTVTNGATAPTTVPGTIFSFE